MKFPPKSGFIGTLILMVAISGCSGEETPPPAAQQQPEQQQQQAQPQQQQQEGEEIALSFDTVRIEEDGTGVVAGRAPVRAQITLSDRGTRIGQVRANSRGEWVVSIEDPLEPGNAELSLRARLSDGRVIDSTQNVSVLVAERRKPTVVLTDEDEASRLLQGEGVSAGGELLLETVDYGSDGRAILKGRSVTQRTIRAYLNNDFIGEGGVSRSGRWEIRSRNTIEQGTHQLRLDQLDRTGTVRARISLPFTRLSEEFSGAVTIVRGDNLWTIARKLYGKGSRYTTIYEMNKDQIRDPDLIYPNQIFALPDRSSFDR